MLANLAIRPLDSRLTGWAEAVGATYTRYADDLAFSGGRALAARADAFVRGVSRIVESEGHELNPLKTRVRGQSVRQVVPGIVVNQRPNLPGAESRSRQAPAAGTVRVSTGAGNESLERT